MDPLHLPLAGITGANLHAVPGAGRSPAPADADAARRLAQSFELQLLQSTSAIGSDPAEGGEDGSEGSDEFGLENLAGLDLMSTLLPALLSSGASSAEASRIAAMVAGAGAQAGAGASLLGGADGSLLSGADGAAPVDAAALLAGGGSAPVTGAGAATASPAANARIVAGEARRAGVDPELAVAMMLVESGGNDRAVGDGGTSFELFQLHRGGMLTAAGLTPEQAFDPSTNAGVALRSLAGVAARYPNLGPGELAATSQRPADPAGYAAKILAALPAARALLG